MSNTTHSVNVEELTTTARRLRALMRSAAEDGVPWTLVGAWVGVPADTARAMAGVDGDAPPAAAVESTVAVRFVESTDNLRVVTFTEILSAVEGGAIAAMVDEPAPVAAMRNVDDKLRQEIDEWLAQRDDEPSGDV